MALMVVKSCLIWFRLGQSVPAFYGVLDASFPKVRALWATAAYIPWETVRWQQQTAGFLGCIYAGSVSAGSVMQILGWSISSDVDRGPVKSFFGVLDQYLGTFQGPVRFGVVGFPSGLSVIYVRPGPQMQVISETNR